MTSKFTWGTENHPNHQACFPKELLVTPYWTVQAVQDEKEFVPLKKVLLVAANKWCWKHQVCCDVSSQRSHQTNSGTVEICTQSSN
jgi:hypothetical protein